MKSKTHENWMFSASRSKLKRWKRTNIELNSFLSRAFLISYIFFSFSDFVKRRVYPMHVSHYLQTQSRYIIIMWRDANGKSGWFSFSRCSYVCDLIQSESIAIILYTLPIQRKVNEKCQKHIYEIKWNPNRISFEFSAFLYFFFSFDFFSVVFRATDSHCLLDAKAIIWKDENQRNEERRKKGIEIRRNRLKPKLNTANRMLFLVEFWIRRWTQARTTNIE